MAEAEVEVMQLVASQGMSRADSHLRKLQRRQGRSLPSAEEEAWSMALLLT